ncbi:hypothetical protein EGJ56_25575, partial [Pandoraea apista]
MVDSTGQPLADARLVTQEGQPVFHTLKGDKGAQVLVTVSESGSVLDSNKLIDKEGFEALNAAIARAQADKESGVVAELKAARASGRYHTAKDVADAMSSYDAVKSLQALGKDLSPEVKARLNRQGFKSPTEMAAAVDVQKKIQDTIDASPSVQGNANLRARLNRLDYKTSDDVTHDLSVQQGVQQVVDALRGAHADQATFMDGKNYKSVAEVQQDQSRLSTLIEQGAKVVKGWEGSWVVQDKQGVVLDSATYVQKAEPLLIDREGRSLYRKADGTVVDGSGKAPSSGVFLVRDLSNPKDVLAVRTDAKGKPRRIDRAVWGAGDDVFLDLEGRLVGENGGAHGNGRGLISVIKDENGYLPGVVLFGGQGTDSNGVITNLKAPGGGYAFLRWVVGASREQDHFVVCDRFGREIPTEALVVVGSAKSAKDVVSDLFRAQDPITLGDAWRQKLRDSSKQFDDVQRTFDEAIAQATKAGDSTLVGALTKERTGAGDPTDKYKTAGELEAALSSYAASKQDADAAQSAVEGLGVQHLDESVAKVPGLDARLMRGVSGTPAQKLAQMNKALAEQTKVQGLINGESHEEVKTRMNAKDYASEQEARADLALQLAAQELLDKQIQKDPGAKVVEIGKKPVVIGGNGRPVDPKQADVVSQAQKEADKALDEAIAQAQKEGKTALAQALSTDKAQGAYHTKEEVATALGSLRGVSAVKSEVDSSLLALKKFDDAVGKDGALNARMNRFAQGRDFEELKAGLGEQTQVQGLINAQPQNSAGEKALVARMNGKDYASEQEARADLALQQIAQKLSNST